MPRFNLDDIQKALKEINHRIAGGGMGEFSCFTTIEDADSASLIWVSPNHPDPASAIMTTTASVIVCANDYGLKPESLTTKRLVITEQPRLAATRIGRALFARPIQWGIHPTAVVDPQAKLADRVCVGAYAVIGKCVIGPECILGAHAQLLDGVKTGNRVTIGPGTVIGTEGFGFECNADGKYERMAHLGGVNIGDDVEIGSCTCIDRGTLDDTVIDSGVKIGNLALIGHNARVGEDTLIIHNAQICGSVLVGKRCWIAPNAVILDRLRVGDDAFIGLGAVAIRDVPPGAKMVGNPARDISKKSA